MLLPSAIPHSPRPHLLRQKSYSAHAQLFSSSANPYLPHTTPSHPSFTTDPMAAETNVQKASRALHEVLGIQTPKRSPAPLPAQRCLRNRSATPRPRHRAPRSVLKRRRVIWEDGASGEDHNRDDKTRNERQRQELLETADTIMTNQENPHPTTRFQTPKRTRRMIPPPTLPLGLIPEDFHNLQTPDPFPAEKNGKPAMEDIRISDEDEGEDEDDDEDEIEAEKDAWTTEEDTFLLHLLLSKFSTGFSAEEWADCARTLGRDVDALRRRCGALIEQMRIVLEGG